MPDAPFQFFRPLSEPDFEALKASIAKIGVQNPILVDENGTTLDGHHRRRACEELGVDCPQKVLTGLSEADKEDLAVTLNVTSKNTPLYVRAFGAARMVDSAANSLTSHGVSRLSTIWSVSEKMIDRAKRVLTKGDPLVVAEVEAERLTMAAAERLVTYFEGSEGAGAAMVSWLARNDTLKARSSAAQALTARAEPVNAPKPQPIKVASVDALEQLADGKLGGFSDEHDAAPSQLEADPEGDALILLSDDDKQPEQNKPRLSDADAKSVRTAIRYATDLSAYAQDLHAKSARSCLFGMEEDERRQFIRDVAAAKAAVDALAIEIETWGATQ